MVQELNDFLSTKDVIAKRAAQDPRFNETTTKREMFAAMAMQGLLACVHTGGTARDIAAEAVQFADALIAALEKQ